MYDKLTSWVHLLTSFRHAARGKRGHPAVAAFEHRLEENLFRLQAELRERSYRPAGYTTFRIHEPKVRVISAALAAKARQERQEEWQGRQKTQRLSIQQIEGHDLCSPEGGRK